MSKNCCNFDFYEKNFHIFKFHQFFKKKFEIYISANIQLSTTVDPPVVQSTRRYDKSPVRQRTRWKPTKIYTLSENKFALSKPKNLTWLFGEKCFLRSKLQFKVWPGWGRFFGKGYSPPLLFLMRLKLCKDSVEKSTI